MEDEEKEGLKRRLIDLTSLINDRWARHSRFYNLRDRRDNVIPSGGRDVGTELFDEQVLEAFEEIIRILEDKGKFILLELPRLREVLSQRLNHFYFKIGIAKASEWYKRVFNRRIGDDRVSLIINGRIIQNLSF
jgi:hypothetical protein